MNYLPFQIDDFRIPTMLEYPTHSFNEGNVWAEHSLKSGGVFLGGVSRKSTKETAIVGLFQPQNPCYAQCKQLTITEFESQLNKIKNKEVKILCIAQDNKIYETTGAISSVISTPLGCDSFTFNIPVRMNPILRDVTNDLWLDTECSETLCSQWVRPKKLQYCDIDKNCEIFKTFFRPDFVPDYPDYFPNLRASLIFLNGQMVTLNGQAILNTGGFINPYPEILENTFSLDLFQSEIELFYFFSPPDPSLTYRRIYINSKSFDIPIKKSMLVVANNQIYVGTAYQDLRPIAKVNNTFYNETTTIAYTNNLGSKDYYGYYKPINLLI
jgi:hypothetical protein